MFVKTNEVVEFVEYILIKGSNRFHKLEKRKARFSFHGSNRELLGGLEESASTAIKLCQYLVNTETKR